MILSNKRITFILICILLMSAMMYTKMLTDNRRLRERIALVERINEEQQAFIRNQRNVDNDFQEQLNQHSEHITLIWNRIP